MGVSFGPKNVLHQNNLTKYILTGPWQNCLSAVVANFSCSLVHIAVDYSRKVDFDSVKEMGKKMLNF